MARVRHAGLRSEADHNPVTAVSYAPAWAPPRAAVAPAAPTGMRRLAGTLHEPNAWTVGVLLATGIVVIARHPIAQALGTEVSARPLAPAVTTSAPRQLATAGALAVPLPEIAAPTHAPRDPFRALVTTAGKLLTPEVMTPATATAVTAAPAAPAAAAAAPAAAAKAPVGACTGTSHRVVAGDTLWTLAGRAVRSADTNRVTIAWHRLYDANRATVGADPSLLRVGTTLCLPSSI